jgi:hypothetical protein
MAIRAVLRCPGFRTGLAGGVRVRAQRVRQAEDLAATVSDRRRSDASLGERGSCSFRTWPTAVRASRRPCCGTTASGSGRHRGRSGARARSTWTGTGGRFSRAGPGTSRGRAARESPPGRPWVPAFRASATACHVRPAPGTGPLCRVGQVPVSACQASAQARICGTVIRFTFGPVLTIASPVEPPPAHRYHPLQETRWKIYHQVPTNQRPSRLTTRCRTRPRNTRRGLPLATRPRVVGLGVPGGCGS